MNKFAKWMISAAALSCVSLAMASDADFKLRNKTGYQIDVVYVSARSSGDWGNDLMGSGSLGDGETLNVTFSHGGSACRFDIQVKYHDDGSTATWNDVNLCNYEKITIFWDSKNQTSRAVGE